MIVSYLSFSFIYFFYSISSLFFFNEDQRSWFWKCFSIEIGIVIETSNEPNKETIFQASQTGPYIPYCPLYAVEVPKLPYFHDLVTISVHFLKFV